MVAAKKPDKKPSDSRAIALDKTLIDLKGEAYTDQDTYLFDNETKKIAVKDGIPILLKGEEVTMGEAIYRAVALRGDAAKMTMKEKYKRGKMASIVLNSKCVKLSVGQINFILKCFEDYKDSAVGMVVAVTKVLDPIRLDEEIDWDKD